MQFTQTKKRVIKRGAALAASLVGVLLPASDAGACAVCFGDPNSDMARGAVAGVLVLVVIVGVVLLGVAGTGVFWIQRARRLTHPSQPDESIKPMSDRRP